MFGARYRDNPFAALPGGAGGDGGDGEGIKGPPPWHLWGKVVTVSTPAGSQNETVTPQLARVNYGRPETWTFFLYGRLTGGDISLGGGQIVIARFNLLLGVGRSVARTQQSDPANPVSRIGFARFRWELGPGVRPGETADNVKYVSTVPSPLLDDTDTTSAFARTFCDRIAAQDIQCECELRHVKSDAAQTIVAQLGAFFAPSTHVRPEWFHETDAVAAQFPGQERGGK